MAIGKVNYKGWWMPKAARWEQHGDRWIDADSECREKAVSYCKNHRTAIDVGAFIGAWTKNLASQFSRVCAFEPGRMAYECLMKNVDEVNCSLYNIPLADEVGVGTYIKNKWMGGIVVPAVAFEDDIKYKNAKDKLYCRPLDSFSMSDVDLIKIDVDGVEDIVVRGAKNTIDTFKPIIVLEIKDTPMTALMKECHGYEMLWSNGLNGIFGHPG